MKFDAFLHPRQQKAPITALGMLRNHPYRLMFYEHTFVGVFFTVGIFVLPYLLHKLDKKIGLEAGRRKLTKEFHEHMSHRVGGTLQFGRDYEYLKNNLLQQWEGKKQSKP